MTADDETSARHVQALALKLAVALLLFGFGFAALLLLGLTQGARLIEPNSVPFLQPREIAGLGPTTLLATGGLAGALIAAVVAARLVRRTSRPEPATAALPGVSHPAPRRSGRPVLILGAGFLCLLAALGLRWARTPEPAAAPASGVHQR